MSTTPIIKHPERIADKWFPGTNTIQVDVTRTAMLSGDLSEIVSRRFGRIDVTLGHGDRRQTLHFDRDEALWLSRALADAVESADGTTAHAAAADLRCGGTNANVCVAEGCYGEACRSVDALAGMETHAATADTDERGRA